MLFRHWCVGLLLALFCASVFAGEPVYRIYPLRNGVCQLAGNHAFAGGDNAETYGYALYFWLILGGDKPMLVDAGLTNIAEMNRGAAHVFREPITQDPNETSRAQLRKFGLKPEDIGHVFITHLHFDHVDDVFQYTNAKIHVGRKEWEGAVSQTPSWGHGPFLHEFSNNPQCRRRLVLVEDQEVLPGVESFWIGGHTPGSTAYRIKTASGWAVLTGDTISLLANFERNTPPGVFARDVNDALTKRPEALQLVEDDEVVPGVRTIPLGCHSSGSQGVLVRTCLGPAVLTGDVVYKYENIEKDRPARSPDESACRQALAKIRRLADIVLPGHDPLTLERWPGGVIGGKPSN